MAVARGGLCPRTHTHAPRCERAELFHTLKGPAFQRRHVPRWCMLRLQHCACAYNHASLCTHIIQARAQS
eukprot:3599341-Alexandrium_andersonii.AAC.1